MDPTEQEVAQFEQWINMGVRPDSFTVLGDRNNPASFAQRSSLNQRFKDYLFARETASGFGDPTKIGGPYSGGGGGTSNALKQLLDFYNQQQTSVGTKYDDLLKRLGNIETMANKRITRGFERGIEQFSRPATDYAQRFGTVNVPANMNAFSNYLQAVGVDPTISQSVQAQQDAVLAQSQGQQQRYLDRMSALESSNRQAMTNALTNAMTQATKAAAREGRAYRFKLEQQRQDDLAKLREEALLAQLKYGK
jgi:hypothetical protein